MREDIFEGIKLAVSRGESLQSAMQGFYNSGYKKEEIEEAARAFQMFQAGHPIPQQPIQQPTQQTQTPNQISQTQNIQEKPKGFFQGLIEKIIPSSKNQNPNQPKEKESPQKIIIILLGAVLFLLLFALIGVLVYKKDIVSFLTGKIIEMLS